MEIFFYIVVAVIIVVTSHSLGQITNHASAIPSLSESVGGAGFENVGNSISPLLELLISKTNSSDIIPRHNQTCFEPLKVQLPKLKQVLKLKNFPYFIGLNVYLTFKDGVKVNFH